MIDFLLLTVTDALWSALAAMGFALLFNVPKRSLIYCMLGSAIGHTMRTFLMTQFGMGIEISTLIGATLVGFWAKWGAIHLNLPSMVIAVSAAIPMVPGVFAYETMIGILQITDVSNAEAGNVLVQSSINAIKTGLILAAIAGGIITPSLIFHRPKPVV